MTVLNFDSYLLLKFLILSMFICLLWESPAKSFYQHLVVCKAAAEKHLATEDFSSREGLRHFATPCCDSFQLVFGQEANIREKLILSSLYTHILLFIKRYIYIELYFKYIVFHIFTFTIIYVPCTQREISLRRGKLLHLIACVFIYHNIVKHHMHKRMNRFHLISTCDQMRTEPAFSYFWTVTELVIK